MTRTMMLDFGNYARTTVGFERLFYEMERQIENGKGTGYPPYNVVELGEDEWMISIAVAGFGMENLNITVDKNMLTVEGTAPGGDEEVTYLHKGIAGRTFRRQFTIADHIEVANATLELGMLNIHLKRDIPEVLQPKKITINSPKMIDR